MATTPRKVVFVMIEIAIFLAVALISIFMRQFLTPFQRGFFRNDESLMHPYHPSTVTNVMMYTVGFLLPGAVVLITEAYYIKFSDSNELKRSEHRCVSSWISECYKPLAFFIFGAASTHLLTNIPKYSIGRLRPHFFDVCKPDWSLLNDTTGYIEADICTGTDKDLIQEARLSFPSGHTSMSMYCAVFLMLYLYKRFTWTGISLFVPLLQLVGFSLAFYTGLSRISDYKHHWSDVLAGAILGVVVACLVVCKWAKTYAEEEETVALVNSSLPHTYMNYRPQREQSYVSSVF